MTKPLSPGYFGQINILNSEEINLDKRTLAKALLSEGDCKKYTRTYETLKIGDRVVPTANKKLITNLLKCIEPKFLADGTIQKITLQHFAWMDAAREICKKYDLADLFVQPQTKATVNFIQVKTAGTSQEHFEKMAKIRASLRKLNANYVQECLTSGPCSAGEAASFARMLREETPQ